MDRFGRKRVITWKAGGLAISLGCLIPLGFVKNAPIDAVLFFLFIALFSTTFTFDLMIFGIEQLPKNARDNYIVTLVATRVSGIAIVSVCFYLMTTWVYFVILQLCLVLVLLAAFMRTVLESPLQIMVASGNHDLCKFVVNSMAIINEEDIIRGKLAFPTEFDKEQRTLVNIVKNVVNSRGKLTTLAVLSVCWLAYTVSQMVHFIYLDRLELNIFVDVIVLGATEFLAALLSKVLLKHMKRRTAFMMVCSFLLACFFFLMIFGFNDVQTRYVVTICTRGVLQIMYIALTVITLEQFSTETRASSTALCMSIGLLGGVGLAFVDGLSTSMLIGLLMLFATGAIGAFFIRETTDEPGLINHYSDILRSAENSALDKLMRNDREEEVPP